MLKSSMELDDALLAVLRLPESHKVRCQAPGCTRPVFQHVHVVRVAGRITVYGSDCFKSHFVGKPIKHSKPSLHTLTGKELSETDRALLDSNTELLLQRLAGEHAANVAKNDQRLPRAPGRPQLAHGGPAVPVISSDPHIHELIRARQSGMTRGQMLAAKGLSPGHPDFYDYSVLLAKAGFGF